MTKGENNHDRRVIDHIKGIQARVNLLEKMLNSMEIDHSIVHACRTQGGLAGLDLPKKGIKPMSLNTLKAAAQRDSPEKWKQLERLRKAVVQLSNAKEPAFKKESPIQSLKIKLDESFRIRAVLYRAYANLIAIVDSRSTIDEILHAKVEQHKKTFRIEVGLKKVGARDEGD